MDRFQVAWDSIREIQRRQAEDRDFAGNTASRLYQLSLIVGQRSGHESRLSAVEKSARAAHNRLDRVAFQVPREAVTARQGTHMHALKAILEYLPVLALALRYAANLAAVAIMIFLALQYLPPDQRAALLTNVVSGALKKSLP